MGFIKDGKLFGKIGQTGAMIGAGAILALSAFFPVKNAVHNRMIDDYYHHRTGYHVEVPLPDEAYSLDQPGPISQFLGNLSFLQDKIFMETIGDSQKYLDNNALTEISDSTEKAISLLETYHTDIQNSLNAVGPLVNAGKSLDDATSYWFYDSYRTEVYPSTCSGTDANGHSYTYACTKTRQVFDHRDHYWKLNLAEIGNAVNAIPGSLDQQIALSNDDATTLRTMSLRQVPVADEQNTHSKIVVHNNSFVGGRDQLLQNFPSLASTYMTFPDSHYERTYCQCSVSWGPEDTIISVYQPIYSMSELTANVILVEQLLGFLKAQSYTAMTTAARGDQEQLAQYLGDQSIALIRLSGLPGGKGHNTPKEISGWALFAGIVSGLAAGGLGVGGIYYLFDNYDDGNYYRSKY
jgi:hypothetical protein